MEREISIPQQALQAVLSEIAEKNEHPNLIWIDQNRTIFSLKSHPEFILRTGYPLDSSDNAVHAKEKALLHGIERVTISPVKLFRLPYQNNTVLILAEKKLDVVSEDEQERLFEEEEESLTQALFELVELIALTKWGAVNSSTIRILRDRNPLYSEERQIAVIPLWMFPGNPADGIFGRRNHPKDGLISCLRSEEQITEVIDYARHFGITDANPLTKSESMARQEVADILKISHFHKDKGITADPRKQLAVNLDSWGLDPQITFEPRWEAKSVKSAIDHIISSLNTSIASALETGTLRDRRRLSVNVSSFEQPDTIYSSKNEPLIREILDTLVRKGVIFGWKETYTPGLYEIQV